MRRTLALAVAVLLLASPARAAEGVDALVDRVLAAYGGKEALAKVRAYRAEGTINSSLRGVGPFARLFARPDRLRVTIDYPGHPETRILDGAAGWRSDGKGGIGASDGALLGSMQLQAARADLPWLLDERRAAAKLLPPSMEGKLQGIEVPLGPGLSIKAYVETGSGRIVRTSAALDTPEMKTTFDVDFTDFRTVDGVLFPFRELSFAGGRTTGDTILTTLTVNPPVAEKDFRPGATAPQKPSR
jgi:hypothetical protein